LKIQNSSSKTRQKIFRKKFCESEKTLIEKKLKFFEKKIRKKNLEATEKNFRKKFLFFSILGSFEEISNFFVWVQYSITENETFFWSSIQITEFSSETSQGRAKEAQEIFF